jgi:hypothetical protein
MSDTYHIIPCDDIRKHALSASCLCKPIVDTKSPDVLIHNSWDGRELFEFDESELEGVFQAEVKE